MSRKSWTQINLEKAIRSSTSIRQVLSKLHLVEAGGNYQQIKAAIYKHSIDIKHFTGKGWRKGLSIPRKPVVPLKKIFVRNSTFQSFKLKNRLFKEGLKKPACEECGWAKCSEDGRIPVELDHINGHRTDNRIVNLRVLCPNCHSLKMTHRGKNKRAGMMKW